VVLYQDEASFQQAGTIHRGWAPVGVGFQVLTPPVRKSAKVMGAVRIGENPKWHFRFVPWFNADSFVDFLTQLVRYYGGTKIHLITDNVPYHKSPKVREWLNGKEHPSNCTFYRRMRRSSMQWNTFGRRPRRASLTIAISPDSRISPGRWQGDSTGFREIRPR
jgi:hypothetical protein